MIKFQRLINKYSVSFTVEYAPEATGSPTANDYNDLGEYVGGVSYNPPKEEKGALLPLPQRVIYNSGGRLTEADRTLYSLNHGIPLKSKITYKGFTYHVESQAPYEGFADFSVYTLKAVSAYD